MRNDEGSPNDSLRVSKKAHWVLSFATSYFIRHSDFVILVTWRFSQTSLVASI